MQFVLFIGFVILQRLLELFVARKNERWARSHGAVEYGQKHYPFIVLLHTCFIISIIVEYYYTQQSFDLIVFLVFLILIALKIWTISSLGQYCNTKILKIPGSVFVKKGPYKYFKHPNYVIVICEIIVIPLVFHLLITAILFTMLNAIMLTVRIGEEEKAWDLK